MLRARLVSEFRNVGSCDFTLQPSLRRRLVCPPRRSVAVVHGGGGGAGLGGVGVGVGGLVKLVLVLGLVELVLVLGLVLLMVVGGVGVGNVGVVIDAGAGGDYGCLLYTSPSPRD